MVQKVEEVRSTIKFQMKKVGYSPEIRHSAQITQILVLRYHSNFICHIIFYEVSVLFNPLSPYINMHILSTIFCTFLMVLLERICSKIKTFYLWWSFHSFSCLVKSYAFAILLLNQLVDKQPSLCVIASLAELLHSTVYLFPRILQNVVISEFLRTERSMYSQIFVAAWTLSQISCSVCDQSFWVLCLSTGKALFSGRPDHCLFIWSDLHPGS